MFALLTVLSLCLPIVADAPGEALREAARLGQTETVRQLLATGVPVDDANQFGVTALYLAANSERIETARVLIDAGADINVQDTAYGFPLVQMVAWKGNVKATRLLIDAGADGAVGAMFAAASMGQADVIQLGLELKVIPPPVLPQLMATASSAGQQSVVDLLASKGVPRPTQPAPPTFVEVSAELLRRCEGSYVSTTEEADTFVVLVRDAGLHIGRTPGEVRMLKAIDETTFAYPDAPQQRIIFDLEDGRVTGYRAVTGGQTQQRRRTGDRWQAPVASAVVDQRIAVTDPQPWGRFRGPNGSGHADGQHPPLTWDLGSGRNVRWKIEVPGFGHSSPVVWGERVFVTTAVGNPKAGSSQGDLGWIDAVPETEEHEWQVRCFDARTGQQVWQRTAHRGVPQGGRHWKASQANCTVATDGTHLIALFGSEGLYCYDLDGTLRWKKDLGVLDAGWYIDPSFPWGFASSPILHDGRVFLQCDVHGQSFVAALDAATGRELWRQEREEIPSWCTPTIAGTGRDAQLVVNATSAVRGYNADSGAELWQVRGNSHITVASPVVADGVILATGGYQPVKPIYAIRPDARGDITPGGSQNSGLLWHLDRQGVYQATPLIYRGLAYLLNDNGIMTCYRAETGEKVYRKRVGGSYTASPIAADGRIYLTSEDGDVRVLAAGEDGKLLAENTVDDVCLATPAISNGALYVRTEHALIAIAYDETGAGK